MFTSSRPSRAASPRSSLPCSMKRGSSGRRRGSRTCRARSHRGIRAVRAPDIKKPLRKLLPHLLQAKRDGLNEADTVQRIVKVLEEVLGYDGLSDISREAQMKGKFVDLTLKIDGNVRVLLEAKAAGEVLRDRHIEQAQSYASRNNYRWVILTNGTAWILYHLTFEEGIEYEKAFSVDLDEPGGVDAAQVHLALLHKQAVKKGELDDFWQHSLALSPAALGQAIFCEEVLAVIRREIRRHQDRLIDPEDLAKAIHDMLSADARELIGPVRVRKKRAVRKVSRPGIAVSEGEAGAVELEMPADPIEAIAEADIPPDESPPAA